MQDKTARPVTDTAPVSSSVFREHKRVEMMRYIFAIVYFTAIFAGTVVTLFFLNRRGAPDGIFTFTYLVLAMNFLMIALCVADFLTKFFLGIYIKWFAVCSYIVAALWIAGMAAEVAVGSIAFGTIRTDLLIISVIQLVVALIAYLLWPMLDRRAVDSMMKESVRGDDKKRLRVSKRAVFTYAMVCLVLVALQVAALFVYKLPPNLYDLFADNRAVIYEASEDGSSYVVVGVYQGTSNRVEIPATYNDKPVVGIKKGALVEDGVLEKYKVTEIVIGTPAEDGEGLESNLRFIEAGAIRNNKITKLELPASVESIGDGAVKSSSLRSLRYSSKADFDMNCFECASLDHIVISGEGVGNIVSLNNLSHEATIEVDKAIYNDFRRDNVAYIDSFIPILENEFYVDIFTNCDYYIDSIFMPVGETVYLRCSDLTNPALSGLSPAVDTLAYINDPHELGTAGAKEKSAFRGWYTDTQFTDEVKFSRTDPIVFTKSTKLFAKWLDEYTGTFDWGTFTPDKATRQLIWTDEDVIDFPVITNRTGYAGGVRWSLDNGEIHADSRGISRDVTLLGQWQLDLPDIDIIPNNPDPENIAIGGDNGNVSFMFDENREVRLTAQNSHSYGNSVTYSYRWERDGADLGIAGFQTVKNVADTGRYKLTVTAHSPLGESSVNTTYIDINITRKTLPIGSALLVPVTKVYNAALQKTTFSGTLPASANVLADYRYTDADGKSYGSTGVRDAGEYRVVVTYKKASAAEAANYTTVAQESTFTVSPKPLGFTSWLIDGAVAPDDSVEFKGSNYVCTMRYTGVVGADSVALTYSTDGAAGNAKSEHGTYTTSVTAVNNPNYTLGEIPKDKLSCEWVIRQKEVRVEKWQLDQKDGTTSVAYDGNDHSVSAVLSGAVAGRPVNFRYDDGTRPQRDANTYTSYIVGVTDENYIFKNTSGGSFTWTINKKQLSYEYTDADDRTYNGGKQGVDVGIVGILAADGAKLSDDDFVYTNSNVSDIGGSYRDGVWTTSFRAVNASEGHKAYVALSAGSTVLKNYAITPKTYTFSIKQRVLTLSAAGSYTYNGAEQPLYVRVSGFITADLNAATLSTFTTDTAVTGCDKSGDIFRLIYRGRSAGSYPVKVSAVTNANYTLKAPLETNITIERKKLTVSGWRVVNEKDKSVVNVASGQTAELVYNKAGYTVSAVLDGVQGSDTVTPSYTGNTNPTVPVTTTTVTATLPASYTDYTMSEAYVKYLMSKKELSLSWRMDGGTSFQTVYDGSDHTLEVILGGICEGDTVIPVYGGTRTARNYAAAGYTASVTALDGVSKNYYSLPETGVSRTMTISPKQVNIAWDSTSSYVYNGSVQAPTFTVSGLIAADNCKMQIAANNRAYTLTGADNNFKLTDAAFSRYEGTYDVRVSAVLTSAGSENANYSVPTTAVVYKSFTITPKPVSLGGVWSYSATGVTGGVYGGSLPYIGKSYTLTTDFAPGMIAAGDSVSLVYNNNTRKDVNTSAATARVTGLAGDDAHNYSLATNAPNSTCSWNITPVEITLTWESASTKTYNGAEQTYRVSTMSGVIGSDAVTLAYTGDTGINVNNYRATASSTDPNYTVSAASASAAWSIEPKVVNSFAWDKTSFEYDGKIHRPTATFEGGKFTVTAYSGDISVKNAHNGYSVTVTDLGNANYRLGSGSGISCTFNITARPLTASWSVTGGSFTPTYNRTDYTVSVSFGNVVSGETVAPVYTGDGVTQRNAGEYTVSVGIKNTDTNYSFAGETKKLTISPKRVNLTWSGNGIKTYSRSAYTVTASVPVISGDTANVAYSTATGYINVGSYTITASGIDNTNYVIGGNASTTLKIDPKPITIKWDNTSFVYNGEVQTVTAQITAGVIAGDSVSLSYTGNSQTDASNNYYATVKSTNSNYTINNTLSWSIQPQVVSVTWTGDTRVTYDGSSHALTATVKGADDNAEVAFSYASAGNSFTDAGSHTVTVSKVNNNNYKLDSTVATSRTLVIDKQQVSVVWTGDGSVNYDGNAHTVTAKVTALVGGKTANVGFGYSGTNSFTAAGSYTVKITLTDTSNFSLASGADTASLVIKKVAASFTYTGTPAGGVVTLDNGLTAAQALAALDVRLTGGSTSDFTVGIYDGSKMLSSSDVLDPAKTYTVKVTLKNANYTLSSEIVVRVKCKEAPVTPVDPVTPEVTE